MCGDVFNEALLSEHAIMAAEQQRLLLLRVTASSFNAIMPLIKLAPLVLKGIWANPALVYETYKVVR